MPYGSTTLTQSTGSNSTSVSFGGTGNAGSSGTTGQAGSGPSLTANTAIGLGDNKKNRQLRQIPMSPAAMIFTKQK